MGLGDWVMASAQVKEANERTGKKVMLGDGKRYFFEKEIFANNPRMAVPGEECTWVPNYGGSRPYITGSLNKHFIFNDNWRPSPGELFFSDAELEWSDRYSPDNPYIVIEPNVKNRFTHGVNKAWPYWEDISRANLPFLQLGDGTGKLFESSKTNTFREALLLLRNAALFVGTDGGLHHAAAALNIPAVVIWTGFSSPKHLGYDTHTNVHKGGKPCGNYGGVCSHCAEIAKSISPDEVLAAINKEFN